MTRPVACTEALPKRPNTLVTGAALAEPNVPETQKGPRSVCSDWLGRLLLDRILQAHGPGRLVCLAVHEPEGRPLGTGRQ